MKKILTLLAGFLLLLTMSCRGADEEAVNPIVGKWAMQKFSYSYVYNGQTQTDEQTATVCEQKSTIEYLADNKGTEVSYYDDSGTCIMDTQAQFTYSYDQNTGMLTMTYPDGTKSVKVESLTSNQMVLVYKSDEAGSPITIKITVKKV